MIPKDGEGEFLLPMPVPPVEQPQGDPATLHHYARNYLQMAWWTQSLHSDLIITGRWILTSMDFDGVRDYVERKLLNLISEAGLHQRGYTLASHACEQYAKRLATLKTGHAELNRQAGAFNQDLNVLLSKCAAGVPPELHPQIAAMHTRRGNLMSAIWAGEQLETQAAESAAQNFLAAKILNSHDLGILRRAADPNLTPEQRKVLLLQAFGVVMLPGMTQAQVDAQFEAMMARSGMRGVMDGIAAEFEAGLARGAARAGLRLVGGALGTIFAVVLDLALFPDSLADGDIDDGLTGIRDLSEGLQKTKLYDADGNEIELPYYDEEPEPEAAGSGYGTGGPPYNCDEPNAGDNWGGPGYWKDMNRGDYEALWKRYEEQITGVVVGKEYTYNGVDFDGFQKEGGQDVFIEAKSRFYSGALKDATVDEDGHVVVDAGSMADKTLQRLFKQLNSQVDALSDVPDAKLRYVMAEADALEKFKAYAKERLTEDEFNRIEWQHIDNDFTFDGC